MSVNSSASRPIAATARAAMALLAATAFVASLLPLGARAVGEPVTHLVVSEVVTGGASASDELIEIYNPAAVALPLEGLELVYVSASGATVTRRAAWGVEAAALAPGAHLLVANELGAYAPMADATYASGMAATGGSVALRIEGAASAIDAVGWGTAASSWLEGTPANAPSTGGSIERLPGGALGSTQDTDDNAADFAARALPDPQNLASPPTPGGGDDDPLPTPIPTPIPTPPPAPETETVSIATARSLPDGSIASIEAVALTASDFTDGGGYLADATGGIAVIVEGGTIARGTGVVATGEIDDRFAQRTLRVAAADVQPLGPAEEPAPVPRSTGSVGEAHEGTLISIAGSIAGAPTPLSSSLAYEVDDGSGTVRVIVGTALGVDTSAWTTGTTVALVGVVGQRDSSSSGTAGYRVQPRGPSDVISVTAPEPTPAPSGGPDATATASPSPDNGTILTVAQARAADKNARLRVGGMITMPPGVIDPASAVLQDATGAILLRLGDEVGPLARGARVVLDATRSTKSGMESLRITVPPVSATAGAEPSPLAMRTGDAGESREAMLVTARGSLVANARRASSGSVSFEIDDGSGPLRVALGRSLAAAATSLTAGTQVEVSGILGQETTGAQPLRGYRIWPRDAAEVRVLESPAPDGGGVDGSTGASDDTGGASSLDVIETAQLDDLRVGATLVSGPWPELKIGGLLWDGERLVAIEPAAAVGGTGAVAGGGAPLRVELGGMRLAGTEPETQLSMVDLTGADASIAATSAPPAAPSTTPPQAQQAARWVSLVGRTVGSNDGVSLDVHDARFVLDLRCSSAPRVRPGASISATGIALSTGRILVPCDGVRSAPTLARAIGAVVPITSAHADSETPSSMGVTAASDGRRLAAAAIILAAVITVVATVAARRWSEPKPASSDPEAVDEGHEVEPVAPDGPRLTLVPVPRERGSP